MRLTLFPLVISIALASLHSQGQIYDTNNAVAQVFAGSGQPGFLNAQGTLANFYNPAQIVADSSSNLFVCDVNNLMIRKITPNGSVSTFVGGGTGTLPGYGTSVRISIQNGVSQAAMDGENTMWLTYGSGILRITADGYTEALSYNNVGSGSGICADSENNIYFSGGNRVYKLFHSGALIVFAGSGNSGSIDANGIYASFNNATTLAADAAGNIYVWDSGKIRRIDQNQNVTTIAGGAGGDVDGQGSSAGFASNIGSMCVDSFGNIIMACGTSIRKMSAATNVVTIAGSFTQASYANGAGALARFNGASGVCLSQGKIFVADQGNQRIRFISFNPQPQPVDGPNLGIATYAGVTINGLVGRTYRIQSASSPNATNWTTETTLLLTRSPYLWFDQNAVGQRKFYRAFLLP